ncbi:LOW QUALITY PROTEIN: N-acetyllactosaminide alpha-1,3-galactosyltransferase-like 1, partial [Ctenodactylus gundi]
VIWEGTYNRQVLGEYYKRLNITIGLAVFASHQEHLIQLADRPFMAGYNVIFYILIDDLTKLPCLYIEYDFGVETLGIIMATNQIFKYDFGVETLGKSVVQFHAWYFKNINNFPYEGRAKSAAVIPFRQEDFYYYHAILGYTPQEVLILIKQYLEGIMHDTTNELSSMYDSQLNRFFNKTTNLLLLGYNWDPNFKTPKHVKIAWQSEMI